jgi:hypothetical protein
MRQFSVNPAQCVRVFADGSISPIRFYRLPFAHATRMR